MIAIRTDANEKIAMGHLMRCLSIAKQLKEKGQEVIFFISEKSCCPLGKYTAPIHLAPL